MFLLVRSHFHSSHMVPGRLQLFHKSFRHRHPTDCIHASQSLPGWASGDRLAFQPPVNENDNTDPLDIPIRERRLTTLEPIQGHCAKPIGSPEFFKFVIEIPHGWTNVIYHSNYQQYLDTFLFNGLIAGETGRKESRQACHFVSAHPQDSKAIPDRKSWEQRPDSPLQILDSIGTRVVTRTNDNYVSTEIISNFLDLGFLT